MSETELRELDRWIGENVTKRLRRRTDEEYADLVKDCEEINKTPHPHLQLTQPSRFEGERRRYTESPADAFEVLKKCVEKLDKPNAIQIQQGGRGNWFVAAAHDETAVESETLELAICLFAKQLFT